VIDLVKRLDVRSPATRRKLRIRFDWEDSVGPRENRRHRLDLAWFTTETNEVGMHEFIDWCRSANTEPMYAINLGTRGVDAARSVVEYANHPGGSYFSDLRKKKRREGALRIKLCCLGNEMDGPGRSVIRPRRSTAAWRVRPPRS
jgi:alpha-N-arabinofuranosidase